MHDMRVRAQISFANPTTAAGSGKPKCCVFCNSLKVSKSRSSPIVYFGVSETRNRIGTGPPSYPPNLGGRSHSYPWHFFSLQTIVNFAHTRTLLSNVIYASYILCRVVFRYFKYRLVNKRTLSRSARI